MTAFDFLARVGDEPAKVPMGYAQAAELRGVERLCAGTRKRARSRAPAMTGAGGFDEEAAV